MTRPENEKEAKQNEKRVDDTADTEHTELNWNHHMISAWSAVTSNNARIHTQNRRTQV